MFKKNKKRNLAILIASIICVSTIGFTSVGAMESNSNNSNNNSDKIYIPNQSSSSNSNNNSNNQNTINNVSQNNNNINYIQNTDYKNIPQAIRYFKSLKRDLEIEKDTINKLIEKIQKDGENNITENKELVKLEMYTISQEIKDSLINEQVAYYLIRNNKSTTQQARINELDGLLSDIDILIQEITEKIQEKSQILFRDIDTNEKERVYNVITNIKRSTETFKESIKKYMKDQSEIALATIMKKTKNLVNTLLNSNKFGNILLGKRISTVDYLVESLTNLAEKVIENNK